MAHFSKICYFNKMEIVQNIVILILCCVALGKGASWLVDSASKIAHQFGISDLVIGLTIVAFGSSAPEFAVTVSGAITGDADVSVGNVIGSNIFNIGFILGGCALVAAIKTRKALVWRDGLVLLATTLLLLVMLYDNTLSRIEGVILFASLVVYLIFLFYKKEAIQDEGVDHGPATWKDGLFLLVGLGAIAAGGYYMIEAATALAKIFNISDWIISMTIVAAGTSVPELVISLVAILKKQHGISAGNLIGSNIFNTLGVLGVAGMIQVKPMIVNRGAYHSVWMLIPLTVLVIIVMRTHWKITRLEGALLVVVGLAIWILNFMMN